jgi:leader peptidase (prepilin peptidase)/N-methyltransferase
MSELTLIGLIRTLLILVLVYLAYIDIRTFQLPDRITLPLIASGIFFNSFFSQQLVNPEESIAGAILGYLCLWTLNRLYRHLKNQDGIGMGDAKLLAGLGAWLGWSSLPAILSIASIVGLLGGLLWLKLKKQNVGSAFPFGPFLAIAGIIELLWPQTLQTLLPSNLA